VRSRLITERASRESDKPAEPYTSRTIADDTIGLMDHLCLEKAHMIVESTGVMVAQELAINYSERVSKLVGRYAC
jgi:3-oxoadipate enol-lactonase